MKFVEKLKEIEKKVKSQKELCQKIESVFSDDVLKKYFGSKSNNKYTMLLWRMRNIIDVDDTTKMNLVLFEKRNEFINEFIVSGMDCYFDIMSGDKFDYDTHIDLVHLWFNLTDSIISGEDLLEEHKLLRRIFIDIE